MNVKEFSSSIIHKIDSVLWRYGFRFSKVRLTLRILILFNIISLVVALISLPFTLAPLSFSLACLLASMSFLEMARTIIFNFPIGGAKRITLLSLGSFLLRLIIVLFISLFALLILQLPPLAWFLGLGIPILCLPLSFIKQD